MSQGRVTRRVVALRLFPDPAAAVALAEVLAAANDAANALSDVAWAGRRFGKRPLQKAHYADLREHYGLPSQLAVRVIAKVADAYTLDQATRREFRRDSAVPFDDRNLTWDIPAGDADDPTSGVISLRGLRGRVTVRFKGADWQVDLLRRFRRGETDLVFRPGKKQSEPGEWFAYATIAEPVPDPIEPSSFLGVDLGIVNIATTSAGSNFSGSKVNRYRRRQLRLRAKLQKKGTKSAKRRLRARRAKETRFVTDVNHQISKQIVAEAQRTGAAIVLENLQGIRRRARLRKPQRTALNSWGFHQLGQHIAYKAERAGIPVLYVDPAYSSQTCAACGHVEESNRVTQAEFVCRGCGVMTHADLNAARVLAQRGAAAWAAVNQPQPVAA